MKYGSIAIKSIKLRGPLKNFHLFGDDQHLSKYSNVNHAIQKASMPSNIGLSVTNIGPLSVYIICPVKFSVLLELLSKSINSLHCKSPTVFRVNAIVERIIKNIEIIAII